MPLLPHVLAALQRVQARLGLPLASVLSGEPPGVLARLNALRTLGQQMEAVTRRAAGQGLQVPERAAPAARRYLDFVEGLVV